MNGLMHLYHLQLFLTKNEQYQGVQAAVTAERDSDMGESQSRGIQSRKS